MPSSKATHRCTCMDASRILSTWWRLIRADVAATDDALVAGQAGLVLGLAMAALAVGRRRIAGTEDQTAHGCPCLGRCERSRGAAIVRERNQHRILPDDVVCRLPAEGALRVEDDVVVLRDELAQAVRLARGAVLSVRIVLLSVVFAPASMPPVKPTAVLS